MTDPARKNEAGTRERVGEVVCGIMLEWEWGWVDDTLEANMLAHKNITTLKCARTWARQEVECHIGQIRPSPR